MDLETIITIVFTSSVVTFGLGWLKDIYFNRTRRKEERFKIQEEAYRQLMQDINFIYRDVESDLAEVSNKKKRFIENYRLIFLHAPDDVIYGINNFLDVMTLDRLADTEEMIEKKLKIAESMLILRKQFIARTKLKKSILSILANIFFMTTFKSIAYQILKEAGKPLHNKEIAKRARTDKSIIEKGGHGETRTPSTPVVEQSLPRGIGTLEGAKMVRLRWFDDTHHKSPQVNL